MQPYLLPAKERLKHWKDFRSDLINIDSEQEQFLRISEYWSQFPVLNHYLDVDSPENWPSPWEMIYNGDLCYSSLAYLMEQTLLLIDDKWTSDRLRLLFVSDHSISDMLMILVIDNKYVLNYSHNEVIHFDNIVKNCIIQNEYTVTTQHYHKII